MEYHLFKKEPALSWEGAKEKHIKSISLDESRINKKYGKAFPYDYDPEIHFVYEGAITGPFKIATDFSLYFYTDEEQALNGYRVLRDGEIITNGELSYVESLGEGYKWHDDTWITSRKYGIAIGSITLESEKEKARQERKKQFMALDLYDKAVLRGDMEETALEKQERDEFRSEWLGVPELYTDISIDIIEIYPVMPESIKYFN